MSTSGYRRSLRIWPVVFVAPFIVFYLVFHLFPIFWSLGLSFTRWNGIGSPAFVGIENYRRLLLEDPFFLLSIRNTVFLMLLYIPVLMVGGLAIALVLHHERLRLARVFRVGVFLPYITTPVAIGIIFGLIFDRNIGVINNTLRALGLEGMTVNWLGQRDSARLVVSSMVVWRYVGYHAVVFLGGLATIPQDLIDAARVDGASAVRRLFAVILPSLRPVVLFLFITDIIGGFQLVEEPMLLFTGWATGTTQIGGPGRGSLTVVWHLYDSAFIRGSNLGLGSAIGYGLFVLIVGFTVVGLRVVGGYKDE